MSISPQLLEEIKSELIKLPAPLVGTITGVIGTVKGVLLTIKAQKELLNIDIKLAMAPIELQKTAVQTQLDTIKSATSGIPTQLGKQIPGLGSLIGILGNYLTEATSSTTEQLENYLTDLNRSISVQKSVEAEIAKLDAIISTLDNIQNEINRVFSGG